MIKYPLSNEFLKNILTFKTDDVIFMNIFLDN